MNRIKTIEKTLNEIAGAEVIKEKLSLLLMVDKLILLVLIQITVNT